MAKNKDYFGLGKLISIILAIIPLTSCICGIATRFLEGATVAGVVRLVLAFTGIGTLVLWILDIFGIVTKESIFRLL